MRIHNPAPLAFLSLLFTVALNVAPAQEQAPTLLRGAAHCLVAKSFLQPSALDLGYFVDTRSWPGERVLYVVSYTDSSQFKGYVYTIFLSQRHGRHAYNIQNNAKFVRRITGTQGVDFVEPPLGGIWTQEHLAAAILRIGNLPRFALTGRDWKMDPSFDGCHSYTDPQ
jgi:hypothetical protein